MPNDALSADVLREDLRTLLGGSQIDIEIADADVDLMATRTLRVYNRFLPFRGVAKLVVTPAQKRYRVDNLHSGLLGVSDVQFVNSRVGASVVDPFDPYYSNALLGSTSADETFGDIAQRRSYSEDASRIVGSEPEWMGQWERVGSALEYALYVDVSRDSYSCSYTFTAKYADSDDPALGRLAIPETDVDWFLNYMAALGKQHLARVRGKHGGVLTPEGSTDTTDADADRSEASVELEALLAEIKMRRPPPMPVIE